MNARILVLLALTFSGCAVDGFAETTGVDNGKPCAELVLAEHGKTGYQIVIPDKGKEALVDKWLFAAAKLMQASFETNGFRIEVVQEGAKATDKPGIYLGATEFAKKNGIKVEQHDDWTYYTKAVGKELVIAGNDKKDPKSSLALLGTVKGVCDFLREYAGVRFLFATGDRFNKDGSLKIDTRSTTFTPMKKIAVPEKIDIKKTPMMRANSDRVQVSLFSIALNYFPPLGNGGQVGWPSATEYAKSHPEYFALTKDGKRACDLRPHDAYAMAVCAAGKGVQDFMYMQAEKLIAGGAKTIGIGTIDG